MIRMGFDNPWAIGALASLPVLVLLWVRTGAWRQRMLARFGRPLAVYRLVSVNESRRRWSAAAALVGLATLIVALAGPRWGWTPRDPGRGHDLVVVLDLSRSMLAEQPSRQTKAFRALAQLAADLEESGRHRVALVVFASHPQLRIPLTPDAEHLRFALAQLDAQRPPQALRAEDASTPSGTRIGAALQLALASFPHARPGRQHLLLVSDGDDPGEDEEWRIGADAAHRAGIAAHVLAIGDATRDYPIPAGIDALRYLGKPVGTRKRTGVLEEISRRTGGRLFTTDTGHLQVLPTLENDWLSLPPPTPVPDAPSTAPAPPVWLLGGALLALGASLWIGDNIQVRLPRPVAAVAVLALVALAAAPTDPGDDALRRGNEAFTLGKFDDALVWYDQAQLATNDPGRIAFHRGAALFRLKRFSEAELAYRQASEDREAPAERIARAHYDRGTSLLALADGTQRGPLEQAVASLQECLRRVGETDLKKDAQHNLEVALLALRRQPPDPPDPNERNPRQPQKKPKPPNENKNGGTQSPTTNPNGAPSTVHDNTDPRGLKSGRKKLGTGPLTVLPDSDKLVPLSREETLAHLERLQQRLLAARPLPSTPSPNFKDW